jgi:hypothetical protein
MVKLAVNFVDVDFERLEESFDLIVPRKTRTEQERVEESHITPKFQTANCNVEFTKSINFGYFAYLDPVNVIVGAYRSSLTTNTAF